MDRLTELLFIVLALVGNFLITPTDTVPENSATKERVEGMVVRVIDGDTIDVLIAGEEERVRYIGIDTPETNRNNTAATECGAEAATEYNESLVSGRLVTLERDVSERDRFGRLLRYLYIDEELVQERIIEAGYAKAIRIEPDAREYVSLKALETQAQSNQIGLWQGCY
jgi:micrococcal nuclease